MVNNPLCQILNSLAQASESSVMLLSAKGQVLKQWDMKEEQVKLQTNISNLAQGTYFVLLKTREKTFWYKWIKE